MLLHNAPKLHLDEHLSPRLSVQLRQYGFDVVCSHEVNLLSESDEKQMAFAVSENRALVTANFSDFVFLHEHYLAMNKIHWGIVLSTQEPVPILLRRLLRFLNTIKADELMNTIRWLNEFR